MHLQPAAKKFNYSLETFPLPEISSKYISLPVHEFISEQQIYLVSKLIKKFIQFKNMKIPFVDLKREANFLLDEIKNETRRGNKVRDFINGEKSKKI